MGETAGECAREGERGEGCSGGDLHVRRSPRRRLSPLGGHHSDFLFLSEYFVRRLCPGPQTTARAIVTMVTKIGAPSASINESDKIVKVSRR